MIKRLISSIFILLFTLPALMAISSSDIYFADKEMLENMSIMRGLEIKSEEEMRSALYSYEGLEAYSVEESSKESQYNLDIVNSDTLSKDGDVIVLRGNVSIVFKAGDGGEKELIADTLIIDGENERITALDNVSFKDKGKNASLNEITADIVTLFWKSAKIIVTEATTSSNRKNSENNDVTFYTQGEKLVYLPDNGIVYENGYISSNPKHRHSSLTAKEIAMLSGGDMFISNAYLKIGRVPILYLPFFFFPGSRITGNPSFGFDSARGAFLNTTFDILGTNKNLKEQEKSSSFSAILKSGEDSTGELPSGFYYDKVEDKDLSKIEAWARKSESYISLMADVYSGNTSSTSFKKGALLAGVDSEVNLFGKKLTIKTYSALAAANELYKNRGRLRYFSVSSLKYSDYGITLNADYNAYSDNRAMIDFANRLSGFSIDPLLMQNPEFPTTYSSEISTLSRGMTLSYSLPSKYRSTYISSLSLSAFRIREQLTWDSQSYRNSTANANQYSYQRDYLELPVLGATISGAIFSTSGKIIETEEVKKTEEDKESEVHILTDPLLKSLYEIKDSASTAKLDDKYSTALRYTLSENLNNYYDYDYGTLKSKKLSSASSSKFTYELTLSSIFKLTSSVSPTYNYEKTDTYSGDDTVSYKETSTTAASDDIVAEIPYLGLKYSISTKLLRKVVTKEYSVIDSVKGDVTETSTEFSPAWDKDTITTHSIAFSKSFDMKKAGTITPSLTYVLPPLSSTIKPSLSYKLGAFASTFQWKFTEEDNGSYKPDLAELSIGYNGTYFTSSFAGKYQSKNYREDDFLYPFYMTGSASVRTKDKKYALTEYLDYAYYDSYKNNIKSLKTTLTLNQLEGSINYKTTSENVFELSDINIKANIKSAKFQLWKGRIYFDFGLTSQLKLDMLDIYNSQFSFTPSIVFSIAEFMDIKFSFTTNNNSIYKYFDDNEKLSWKLLFEDLGRSLDFFGKGRSNTSFIMNSAALDFVHYMEDWDLHCAYKTEVVLSNDRYSLVPEFRIYLSWKTMPDLKVDQTWNKSTGEWVKK